MGKRSRKSFFDRIADPDSVVTPIDSGMRFPETMEVMHDKYADNIRFFADLVKESRSSGDLLRRIRSSGIPAAQRMSLLKIFRRCVSGICDTEKTKKIRAVSTESLIATYGHTFKPIAKLKKQFAEIDERFLAALSVLVGEYDNRGQQGYVLEAQFFDWFESNFGDQLLIAGPRGPGPDVELSSVISDFRGACPCDFVIRRLSDDRILAVGFARYDSTRGGAQSDDRTGGNVEKVFRIRDYFRKTKNLIKIIFLADGPGLTHRDTWRAACELDRIWSDNVRVTTLKLASERITLDWLFRT